MVVWKFTLKVEVTWTLPQTISMPQGSIIRHVAMQNDELCLWAECTQNVQKVDRYFALWHTGEEIPWPSAKLSYLKTILLHDGQYVLHLYEVLQ